MITIDVNDFQITPLTETRLEAIRLLFLEKYSLPMPIELLKRIYLKHFEHHFNVNLLSRSSLGSLMKELFDMIESNDEKAKVLSETFEIHMGKMVGQESFHTAFSIGYNLTVDPKKAEEARKIFERMRAGENISVNELLNKEDKES